MSELSHPKKPRAVSDEDTVPDVQVPGVASRAAGSSNAGGSKEAPPGSDGRAPIKSKLGATIVGPIAGAPSKAESSPSLAKGKPSKAQAAKQAPPPEAADPEIPVALDSLRGAAAPGPAAKKASLELDPESSPSHEKPPLPDEPLAKEPPSKIELEEPTQADLPRVEEILAESIREAAAAKSAARGSIVVRVFGRTDVGQVREHNEDNFVVADLTKASRGLMEHDRVQQVGERGTVLGVCDGMGGAAAGEVASQLAVDIVYQRMLQGEPPESRDDLAARLVGSIESAGMRIFAEAKADRSRRGMGTTATIAALIDDHLFFGQVGDSRAYLLRGDRLVQVTRDQSLVNQLIEAGQLTEEEAETFEHNNIILQALGTAESVQVDLTYVELRRGDTLLLCSDGLSGMVRNDEIREVLRSFDEPLEACRELTDRANLAGGHDNVTVVVAKFDGEGLKALTPQDVADLKYRKYELPEHGGRTTDIPSHPSAKSSMRPQRPATLTPDIEVGYDDYDAEYPDSEALRSEDPVELPREQAPSWIVTMMIVSAVTCVVVAGYYLLK